MSDLFDDFNKILKKDMYPILSKFFRDPNNKITDQFNNFINDSQTLLTDIFEKISKNKDYNNKRNYTDIENLADIDPTVEDEYNNLLKRLILIEENMIQMENILKDKNDN
tara:strand:+ start:171 stop:500 length:330 start_codon:yes stop_codon:yes gene_type:complete